MTSRQILVYFCFHDYFRVCGQIRDCNRVYFCVRAHVCARVCFRVRVRDLVRKRGRARFHHCIVLRVCGRDHAHLRVRVNLCA